MLIGMTIWQVKSPSIERKGFLPIATTRGDRLFIGLLSAAYVNLAWAGLTDVTQYIGAVLGFAYLIVVMRLINRRDYVSWAFYGTTNCAATCCYSCDSYFVMCR